MNILFLLLPKSEVDFVYSDMTTRQVLEKMKAHHYSMIPMLERKTGHYLRSITDGEILNYILENRLGFDALEQTPILSVPSMRNIKTVPITAEESDLFEMIISQNYVPVVDDKGVFIGIVTRKKVLTSTLDKIKN